DKQILLVGGLLYGITCHRNAQSQFNMMTSEGEDKAYIAKESETKLVVEFIIEKSSSHKLTLGYVFVLIFVPSDFTAPIFARLMNFDAESNVYSKKVISDQLSEIRLFQLIMKNLHSFCHHFMRNIHISMIAIDNERREFVASESLESA
ncbi:2542_t:CDS:2, partial [Funneliformis caledonium]